MICAPLNCRSWCLFWYVSCQADGEMLELLLLLLLLCYDPVTKGSDLLHKVALETALLHRIPDAVNNCE